MLNLNLYFFNLQALPIILVSTLIFATGLFVFLQNKTSPTNIIFFLFCLSLNFWLYGNSMMYCSKDPANALRWYRWVTFLGVTHISPLVFTFTSRWLNLYERQRRWVILSFVLAPIFYLLGFTRYGIPYAQKYYWGYYPHYGFFAQIFLFFFFGYFLAAFYNFFSQLKVEKDPIKHKQIQLITIAFLISITGSFDYIPKIIRFSLYPFGYLSVFFWTALVAYLIVRYRILDIETVIHKTIMWLLTSAVLGAPLVIGLYFSRPWLLSLHPFAFLGVVSAVLYFFTFYVRWVQPKVDHLFQRRQWDLMRALEKFTDELVHLKSLDEVATHVLNTVKTVFYLTNVSLLVRKQDTNAFALAGSSPSLSRDYRLKDDFLRWLETNDKVVIREYVKIDPQFKSISDVAETYFQSLDAVLCAPLIVNKKLIGILNIGQKRNLQSFRAPEINFLADLRRSAAIALSNALHLIAMQENLRKWNEELEKKVDERTKQLQETQAQLVQAEKLATIGTLAGGVAHEVNNPLTAVLTNAQLLKMNAQPDDLESISLIEEGAKRCQMIIQKLMKYARKPLGHETVGRVDLNKVIDNTIAFLEYQFKQENIQLSVEKNESPLLIEGNANELEQVVTNLVLNAKDAIKQTNHEGFIKIKTDQHNGSIEILVTDNGVGISPENLPKIFDPFFTTKELGKGTGLGLAVSYGIIQKHKGQIRVVSTLGKGTTFEIVLPKS